MGDTHYDLHFEWGRGGGETHYDLRCEGGGCGGGVASILDAQSLFFLLK